MEKDKKQRIALVLGLSAMSAKNATVNPSDFDTTTFLGLIPGVVKPILEPDLVGNVFGICYMHLAQPEDFVIVSVSPIDSMIFSSEAF